MKTAFYLDNTLINEPQNHQELEIELSFDKDKSTVSNNLTLNSWDFVRENTDKIQKWKDDGFLFEGMPFAIDVEDDGSVQRLFDGYLDLSENATFSKIKTTVTAKEKQKIDELNDNADGFTYEYLYKTTGVAGQIFDSDFVYQPYILNSIPNYTQSAITLVSVYIVSQTLKDAIQRLSEIAASLANPFEATAIIRAILLIAYIGLLLIALINLIKDVINFIIQPVKYHSGMYVKTLLEKGAEHLGYTFKSEIFNNAPFKDAVIIPRKFYSPANVDDDRIFGFTSPSIEQEGYYKGTFGDLLRAVKTIFKAKILITNDKELFLVREDKNIAPPQYILPDLYQPYYKTNADEFRANYLISFQTDTIDKNTIQQYQGTSYQVIAKPVTYKDKGLVLMKGLEEVRIPFALAKRKTELTVPERIADLLLQAFDTIVNAIVSAINVLIDAANAIIDVINGIVDALDFIGIDVDWQIETINNINPVNLSNLIDNRIGMMMIENDQINVDKIFIIERGGSDKFNKIHPQNGTYMSAKYLWDNFHFIASFVPSTEKPNGNQYILKEFDKVPFCLEDYFKVKNNNSIYIANTGSIGEVDSLRWNPYKRVASMKIRISTLITNNLRNEYFEPTGI